MSSIIWNGDTYHGIRVESRGVFTNDDWGSTYAGQCRDGYACGLGVTTHSGGSKAYAEHGPDGQYDGRNLCRDADGRSVAIEIKRRGEIDGVEQLARYLERMDLDPDVKPVRGIFVAQSIKPQARVLAEARGIECVEVDYDELRGIESDELRLF